ncbi:hypothetical protein FSP39_015826 [Pinctada imbricata]|uniref:Uncharacterized protein n=1 Tax=Pinctada imbricata TaxID=66713 RepID=A0AA89BTR6_PINIB|nr:hypothetical protein FSP39_015826 [Pinctada imbricata]
MPSFQKLKANYPGYKHHGGQFRNKQLVQMIGCSKEHLQHDTSALRLSYALNKVGSEHSLGKELIRLSRLGEDSVAGRDGLQYLYHPIAYGPFLADKYGYPSISKPHQKDPVNTEKNFRGKQGILRVITYTKHSNLPKGHVALWDCNRFHQSKDWIAGHTLITVEFWESPDSNCQNMMNQSNFNHQQLLQSEQGREFPNNQNNMKTNYVQPKTLSAVLSTKPTLVQSNAPKVVAEKVDIQKLLHNKSYRRKYLKHHFVSNGRLRHARHRGMTQE